MINDFISFCNDHHGQGFVKDIRLSGSSVICDPPVIDTDVDYLILVEDLNQAGAYFSCEEWTNCFEDWNEKTDKDPFLHHDEYTVELESGARFQAWRCSNINVILTDDETLHLRNRAATLLAKELNLLNKSERIKLFRCIKFGEAYGGRYA